MAVNLMCQYSVDLNGEWGPGIIRVCGCILSFGHELSVGTTNTAAPVQREKGAFGCKATL
jgi:hypothetical protein